MSNLKIKCRKAKNTDIYDVSFYTGLSTKEYEIHVNYVANTISGDVVAFGSHYKIDKKECMRVLEIIQRNQKAVRQYTIK